MFHTLFYFVCACAESAFAVAHYYNGEVYWLSIIAAILFYACGAVKVIKENTDVKE